ncbi:MAG: hypothetical protein HYX92_14640 [Chloroflexi bacterium]|nr:hypothetical protein [Chloroflexota bacterium]
MWVQVKSAPNLILAEMWKELFEGEGIPTRILPDPVRPGASAFSKYNVFVAKEKTHVVAEILRKI